MRSPSTLVLFAVLASCGATDGAPSDAATPLAQLPPDQHGPKCTVELVGGPAVDCISAVIARHGDTTILSFNFCWRNDMYLCGAPAAATIDGIFILPGPEWREGAFSEAGGFLDVQVRNGPHHLLEPAAPGRPIPIDLRVVRAPVTSGGSTLRGRLDVSLPRVDGAGEPLSFRATIN